MSKTHKDIKFCRILAVVNFHFSESNMLKTFHKCHSCGKKPNSLQKAVTLLENMDSYVTFIGQDWLLCQICDLYIHVQCYAKDLGLKKDELKSDVEYFKSGGRYICSKCRMLNE